MKNYVEASLDTISISIADHGTVRGQEGYSWNLYHIKINDNALPASMQKYKYLTFTTLSGGQIDAPIEIALMYKYPMYSSFMFERNDSGIYVSAPELDTMKDAYLSFFDENKNLLGNVKITSSAKTFEMSTVGQ